MRKPPYAEERGRQLIYPGRPSLLRVPEGAPSQAPALQMLGEAGYKHKPHTYRGWEKPSTQTPVRPLSHRLPASLWRAGSIRGPPPASCQAHCRSSILILQPQDEGCSSLGKAFQA